jgi:hypothetical protein
MKKSLAKVISMSAAIILVSSLTACGGDSDSSRDRNSALDPVACLDGSAGTLTAENELKVAACATATKWATVASDGTEGEQKDIVDGSISLPVVGQGPVTVKTFSATGEVVATDVVKPNGSRGGIVYRIDTSGEQPVYYEAAPVGWAGTTSDPRTDDPGYQTKIDEYNNASTPAADWYLGNEWEMATILSNEALSNALGISGGDWSTMYWTSARVCSICALMIERPAIAQFGYTATYAYDPWCCNNYLRPIRSFTSGSEAIVAVIPQDETTTTTTVIAEETSTTSIPPVTTTLPLDPIEQVVIDIVDPIVTVVKLPAEETNVTVIPAIVQEWVSGRTTEEIASVEISFNGETYLPIAMEKPTELTIPVTATEATLRVTTAAGEKVEIDKTLQRTGETVEATTTTTSTVPPTPADEIPDEGTSASTSSDDESSSNTIWVILGAVVVLGAAGAAFQLRRKKK